MKKLRNTSSFNRGDLVMYKGIDYIFAHSCNRDDYVVLYDLPERKPIDGIPVHHVVPIIEVKPK